MLNDSDYIIGLEIITIFFLIIIFVERFCRSLIKSMQQVKVSKQYPRHHSGSALMNLMGALQATALALCVDKDRSQWKLGLDIRLLTALFTVS